MLNLYNDGITHINIGSGEEISIKDLANLIKEIIEYNGGVYFNSDYPDGTPRKLLDVTRLDKLGWKSIIDTEDLVNLTINWYKSFYENEDVEELSIKQILYYKELGIKNNQEWVK